MSKRLTVYVLQDWHEAATGLSVARPYSVVQYHKTVNTKGHCGFTHHIIASRVPSGLVRSVFDTLRPFAHSPSRGWAIPSERSY